MLNEIDTFLERYKKVYIYGCGQYGHVCKSYLEKKSNEFVGFITTSGEGGDSENVCFKAEEVVKSMTSEYGVILAMNSHYAKEVLDMRILKDNFVCFDENVVEQLYYFDFGIYDAERNRFKKVYEGEPLDNILVVQVEVTYGDMIWSSAFLRELRRNNEKSRITLVINEAHKSLFTKCPYIDEVLLYSNVQRDRVISDALYSQTNSFVKEKVIETEYDAVILPRFLPAAPGDLFDNILIMQAVNAKYRFGIMNINDLIGKKNYDTFKKIFTSIYVDYSSNHVCKQELGILSLFDQDYVDSAMEIWLKDSDYKCAENALQDNKRYIAVAPVGSTKNRAWAPMKYVNVIRNLSRINNELSFVILGGPDAEHEAEIIIEEVPEVCINLVNKTSLTEAAAVISKCILYLGADTGLMQMASAMGVPIVEISHVFKTTPESHPSYVTRTGPWMVKNVILMPDKGLDGCEYYCRRDSHCINQITEEEVVNAVIKLVEESVLI